MMILCLKCVNASVFTGMVSERDDYPRLCYLPFVVLSYKVRRRSKGQIQSYIRTQSQMAIFHETKFPSAHINEAAAGDYQESITAVNAGFIGKRHLPARWSAGPQSVSAVFMIFNQRTPGFPCQSVHHRDTPIGKYNNYRSK